MTHVTYYNTEVNCLGKYTGHDFNPTGHFRGIFYQYFTSFFLNFLQLYYPNGISPIENSGCLPWGQPAATVALLLSLIHI